MSPEGGAAAGAVLTAASLLMLDMVGFRTGPEGGGAWAVRRCSSNVSLHM
jgi:hypothetical protein